MPGRVGYQCANFYRQMVRSGELKGVLASLDAPTHSKKRKRAERTNSESEPPEPEPKSKKEKVKKPPRKKHKRDDMEYRPGKQTREEVESQIQETRTKTEQENPLVGFRDFITKEPVVNPLMSPHGHVLSRDTWNRILSQPPMNTCPFTKKPLKKRDLLPLTKDNLEEYRSMIIEFPEMPIPCKCYHSSQRANAQ